jgi:hypothetical protein
MDPVPVPAPPRSAYNPNRRVSDLIYSQLRHFQHVELKRGDLGIDPELARNIHTEGGAAKYIAAVTAALRGKTLAASAPANLAVMPAPKPATKPQAETALSIAAAAETSSASGSSTAKKAAKKASTAKGAAMPKPNKGMK